MGLRYSSFGRWLAMALFGALAGYLYAVLRLEPVAHSASLAAWQWFGRSYGASLLVGLLLGAAAGALLVWLDRPRAGAEPSR